MRLVGVIAILLVVGLPPAADGQTGRYTEPVVELWQIGMTVDSPGTCNGIVAAVPVPMDWPEQQVEIVAEDTSTNISSVRYRTIDNGVRQMQISIARLSPGDSAHAMVTFRVTKCMIGGPSNTTGLIVPPSPARELRDFLGNSPSIETSHAEITAVADSIDGMDGSAWHVVQSIYDWVREHIEYEFDVQLKGALTALRAGRGDCEEMTSLFIALCRAKGVPARSVWIPGHCYPEFYLELADGRGYWFPCQAAGEHQFGGMRETRPILQKGDRFRVPGERETQRYVAETFRAANATANPVVKFLRTRVDP